MRPNRSNFQAPTNCACFRACKDAALHVSTARIAQDTLSSEWLKGVCVEGLEALGGWIIPDAAVCSGIKRAGGLAGKRLQCRAVTLCSLAMGFRVSVEAVDGEGVMRDGGSNVRLMGVGLECGWW